MDVDKIKLWILENKKGLIVGAVAALIVRGLIK